MQQTSHPLPSASIQKVLHPSPAVLPHLHNSPLLWSSNFRVRLDLYYPEPSLFLSFFIVYYDFIIKLGLGVCLFSVALVSLFFSMWYS
ncbi:hypothetical protein L211DRAFT_382005 [Terfezia boudieri ATCC MYA-4762]|uniref:Uncharacterized protein n=1 Tax=Terfezia boudieri ATCC MYA-4762 TaxID=1051890 RepID=A0A3N4LZQ8_9PEZI|nr:hypothetical protein L211DRAFT_382005 [Terfezia boudieri ATCC MYA-4762]